MPYVVKGDKVEYHRTDRDNKVVEIWEEDVFDFLDAKLAFATGETEKYLTHQGRFIVEGNRYSDDWVSDAENYGYADGKNGEDIDLRNGDKDVIRKIKERFDANKAEWYRDAGIDETNIHIFELLHEQYEALRAYAKDNTNQQAIDTIVRTYRETGINCLTYLSQVKSLAEWASLTDFEGSMICAVIIGHDPNFKEYPFQERKDILDTYHRQFYHYTGEVDRLVKEAGLGDR